MPAFSVIDGGRVVTSPGSAWAARVVCARGRRAGATPALTASTDGQPPPARMLRDHPHRTPKPTACTSHGVPDHGTSGHHGPAARNRGFVTAGPVTSATAGSMTALHSEAALGDSTPRPQHPG
jgi:hypothetical protein